jgi:glycosyltransferase involved in cell wall biosynthesis
VDRFTSLYRGARTVTFYSRGLLNHASTLGLGRPGMRVVYPPVAPVFTLVDSTARAATRAALGVKEAHVLLNVKRLHPLAGQRHLLAAMPDVLRPWPDTRLIICGTGPIQRELEDEARALGVAGRTTFAGLMGNDAVARFNQAADLFVLPSLLEACPTVALEALASGTPVVSSDNPGGIELNEIFGDDVAVVPRGDSSLLAAAIITRLQSPRRTTPATNRTIEDRFRSSRAASEFREVYRDVLAGRQ